ncbi:MAG: putative NADH-quinone oxidoreductase subunit [Planctomycetota bacterium]|jgi:NADH-quinone oxidoreductase subunit J
MDCAPLLPSFHQLATLAADDAPSRAPALAIVVAAAIAAAGFAFLMRPDRRGIGLAGVVLGLAGFALLMVEALRAVDAAAASSGFPPVFPVVFGLLAVFGAVRLVTHRRPVFAALYFVLVVIATAGMFLLLGAEFMAFSLVIVYAGAILITYMFVLMLAQQSPVEGAGDAWYDRTPREPLSAIVVGFIMLATLGDAFLSPAAKESRAIVAAQSAESGREAAFERLAGMPKLLLETATRAHEAAWRAARADAEGNENVEPAPAVLDAEVEDASRRTVRVALADDGSAVVAIPDDLLPDNARQVGVDLVSRYPAGLEIAGVVLLMALFGAVILARRQIELGEDERRSLAGMRRYSIDADAPAGPGGSR